MVFKHNDDFTRYRDQPMLICVSAIRSSWVCVFQLFIKLHQWCRSHPKKGPLLSSFYFLLPFLHHLGVFRCTQTHTRNTWCQQLRGRCPGRSVSRGETSFKPRRNSSRATAANVAHFTQLHTGTSPQQCSDTQQETTTSVGL